MSKHRMWLEYKTFDGGVKFLIFFNKKGGWLLEKLALALKQRGFLATKMDDHIYFWKGNHENELWYLKNMFTEWNINVRIDDRNIYF